MRGCNDAVEHLPCERWEVGQFDRKERPVLARLRRSPRDKRKTKSRKTTDLRILFARDLAEQIREHGADHADAQEGKKDVHIHR